MVQRSLTQKYPVKALLLVVCPILTMSCGDVAASVITRRNSGQQTSPDTGSLDAGSSLACASGSLEFRALLLIKDRADVGGVSYTLDQTEIEAATAGFKTTLVDWISTLTNGRLCLVPQIYVSPNALSTFSNICGNGPTPWIPDVAADLQQLVPAGKYDSVFLYARNGGTDVSCGYWPTAESNYASFAYLSPVGAAAWQDRDQFIYEELIWAWLVALIHFYQNMADVTPPPVPGPNDWASNGYARDMAPYSGLKTWYGDLLDRKVMQNGVPSGLGEPAWAHGTMRAAAPLQ